MEVIVIEINLIFFLLVGCCGCNCCCCSVEFECKLTEIKLYVGYIFNSHNHIAILELHCIIDRLDWNHSITEHVGTMPKVIFQRF